MSEINSSTVPEKTTSPSLETEDRAALQEEIARLQHALAEMTKERDAYRRAVQAWAMQEVSAADVERYGRAEAGLPLEEFFGELEQLCKDARHA